MESESSSDEVRTRGFSVVRGLIDPQPLLTHLSSLIETGKGAADTFVRGSRVFYREPRFEVALRQLLPKIEARVGRALFQTYSFARYYDNGQVLAAHKDRAACEISVSICLGHEGKPWPLWLLDKAGTPNSVELNPGDGLIYKGSELMHWRQKNVYGPTWQLFLHYVDQDGPYAIHREDQQMSLPESSDERQPVRE